MKHLKTSIVATVAAAAMMAFVGVGTASADFLCTTTPTPCTSPIGMIEASINSNAKFSETGGKVIDECKGSKLTWKIESQAEGGAVTGSILGLTWTGCEGGGLGVTTETVVRGKLLVRNITGTMNGSVEAGGTAVTLNLPLIGTCTYQFSTLGTLTSGAGAAIDVNAVGSKVVGSAAGCQGSLKLTAEYVISNHTAVFVHHF